MRRGRLSGELRRERGRLPDTTSMPLGQTRSRCVPSQPWRAPGEWHRAFGHPLTSGDAPHRKEVDTRYNRLAFSETLTRGAVVPDKDCGMDYA
jgi:hypothetical protein